MSSSILTRIMNEVLAAWYAAYAAAADIEAPAPLAVEPVSIEDDLDEYKRIDEYQAGGSPRSIATLGRCPPGLAKDLATVTARPDVIDARDLDHEKLFVNSDAKPDDEQAGGNTTSPSVEATPTRPKPFRRTKSSIEELRRRKAEPDQKVEWHGGRGFGASADAWVSVGDGKFKTRRSIELAA